MNLKRLLCASVILPVVVAGLTGCGGGGDAAADGATTVRFGSVGGLTDAGLYIADAKGYFDEAGVEVEFERMAGGTEISSALSTNNLDAAGFALTAGFFNAIDQGLDLKVVGDKQSILPDVSATRVVANKSFVGDSAEETYENLRGKTVGISAMTSATVATLDFALQEYGMSIDDFDLREMAYPEMTAALLSGQLDAAVELEPFLTQALDSEDIEEVDDLTATVGEDGGTLVPLVLSQSFIDAEPEAAQGFMTAYTRGVREYNAAFLDDENRDEIVQIIADASGQDVSLVERAKVAGLSGDQVVSTDFLNEVQDWFVQRDLVENPIDVTEAIDTSFADKAIEELDR